MKTKWNDQQGSRSRQPHCLLVPLDGRVYEFRGEAIPGVCATVVVAHEKKGKWSNSTWEISHAETTAVVQFTDDWGTGRMFPQTSWAGGFLWLAEQAPALSRAEFVAFVRQRYPKVAERWDAAAAAEAEFGVAATPEEVAAIRPR